MFYCSLFVPFALCCWGTRNGGTGQKNLISFLLAFLKFKKLIISCILSTQKGVPPPPNSHQGGRICLDLWKLLILNNERLSDFKSRAEALANTCCCGRHVIFNPPAVRSLVVLWLHSFHHSHQKKNRTILLGDQMMFYSSSLAWPVSGRPEAEGRTGGRRARCGVSPVSSCNLLHSFAAS